MMFTDPDFSRTIYNQLNRSLELGFEKERARLPVISDPSLSIALGCNKSAHDSSEFNISLRQHPTGAIILGVESAFGLSIASPSLYSGSHRIESSTEPVRGELLAFTSTPNRLLLKTVDFTGEAVQLKGLNEDGQRLLAAQLAGFTLGRSMRKINK